MPAPPPANISLNRLFGLLVGGALLLAAAYYYLRYQAPRPGLLVGGGLLWALAGLAPRWLTPVRLAWEGVGRVLGWLNTHILLLLAYGLVCVPLGGLLRLRGKDPLGLKWLPNAPTYWQAKGPRSSLRFQF